jgi:hypothetical protein
MKILLGDFNAKVGKQYIFKPTIVKSLHNSSNSNSSKLLSTWYKIVSNILLSKLSPYMDEIAGDY